MTYIVVIQYGIVYTSARSAVINAV